MDAVPVRVDASGRFVLPQELREALGIPSGGDLRLTVEDGELRCLTRLAALRRLQCKLAALKPPGDETLVVDELIADRRAEAAREAAAEAAWDARQRDAKPAA